MTALLVNWAVGGASISVGDYDLLWATIDPDNNPSRKQAFRLAYRLVPSTCFDGEGNPYSCYRLNNTYWSAFAAFALTSDFICEDICPMVTFHELH